jgi:7-cyano-7-deazaguanine synthase
MAAKAVVLLSGGMDSATTLAEAIREGYESHALTVRYGQRHAIEIERARRLAETLGAASHRVVEVDLRFAGGSALTDPSIDVPKTPRDTAAVGDIPITYVPARNTVLLSLALAWAEVLGARDLFVGVNAVDYSGYPDCRPEFLLAFEALANVATKAGLTGSRFRVHAPLLRLTKGEIVRKAFLLGVDLSLTLSCYDPSSEGRPCGRCEACRLRARGFQEAGLSDPAAGTENGP